MSTSGDNKFTKIRTTFDKIKENKFLDAAAKALLQEVPVVGNFLVNLYDNSSKGEEDKTKEVIKILENLQQFNQQQLEELVINMQKNTDLLQTNQDYLFQFLQLTDSVVNKLNEISNLISQLSFYGMNESYQIKEKISKLEDNLIKEIDKLNLPKFDFRVKAEQLLFYLKLIYFLDNAYQIFIEQNEIAKNLRNRILSKGHKIRSDKKGLDYVLYYLHKDDKMDENDLKDFEYIRKVTDDTERFNWYAKELLIKNNEFFDDLPVLNELFLHYSTWQAKYELYKYDKHMCLIYVGPDQHAGFPSGIEKQIDEKIYALKKMINLHNEL